MASRHFFRQLHGRIADEGGMGPSQFCLLKILGSVPTCTVSDIAQRLDMTVAGATGLIDRLVRANLVVRRRDETDRRVVHTALSEEGKQALAAEIGRRRAIMAGCMAPLTQDEVESFVSVLEKLTRATVDSGSVKE
ncbi:MAG TPA: MarR family transcriptional regulator [Symbiobacteriaceae bacterium]